MGKGAGKGGDAEARTDDTPAKVRRHDFVPAGPRLLCSAFPSSKRLNKKPCIYFDSVGHFVGLHRSRERTFAAKTTAPTSISP
eukprot:COSAG05_NODE_13871_length_415_cov_1.300633_1_plen_82_part_10